MTDSFKPDKGKLVFRGRPERTDVKFLGTINANTAPLVFSYRDGLYEHITQRPLSGKVGWSEDPNDIINAPEQRVEFRIVSALTGAVCSAHTTLATMREASEYFSVKPFGYFLTTFEDEKVVSVTFHKWGDEA